MKHVTELAGHYFRARVLEHADGVALQDLLEKCSDYCEMVLGRPPGPAEAQSVFLAGPEEGHDPSGKLLLGIFADRGDEMVGVLDAFVDYPRAGVWYIGLLLLVPATRGSGVGRDILEAFAEAARRRGATALELNVVEQNVNAHRFWTAHGFKELRRWRQRFGERDSTFIRMSRLL